MILANDSSYTYHLRRELILQLIADGHAVCVVCEQLLCGKELEALGCRQIAIRTERHGTNPIRDFALCATYLRLMRSEKPDVVLTFNIKPNVYGGLASRLLGVSYITNVTGLGVAVERPGPVQMLTIALYRCGLARAACVFFQNEENERFFRRRNIISAHARFDLLPGSGVNLRLYEAMPYPSGETTHFLFVARIMKEKGIDLYLHAASRIQTRFRNTAFHICGACDEPEYAAILREAEQDGTIRYHGEQTDMRPFFELAHCVVHPSYYPEGMSNVLLEAAACARPIITTNRSGCRETVEDGTSGYLVPIRDEEALVAAIERFLALSWEEKQNMGRAGREKVEREFDRGIVVKAYRQEIRRATRREQDA